MAIELGINADANFLGNTGVALDFFRECGSVTLIDDREWKLLPILRANNSTQILCSRYHYEGAEGRWRDIEYDGKPQTPQRMFEVLSAGYKPELGVWVYFGNEPARGPDPTRGITLDRLKADVEFYCQVVEILRQNKVKVVVQSIQAPELTPETLPIFKPLFELCHKYPELVAFGIHQYFSVLLPLGVGSGDWSKLVKWGSHPKEQWATTPQLAINSAQAHIGRDTWVRAKLNEWGYTKVRFFNTECGFDRINNLPQLQALDDANGRPISGLQTIKKVLNLHAPDRDAEKFAAEQMIWMAETLMDAETLDFYCWSTQDGWKDYSCDSAELFKQTIITHNRKVRAERTKPVEQPTEQTKPIVVTTPVVVPRYTIAEMAEIIAAHELNPNGLIARLAVDAKLVPAE